MTPAKGKGTVRNDGLEGMDELSCAEDSPETTESGLKPQKDYIEVSPGALPTELSHPHPQTRRTTGFSGSVSTPDPLLTMQAHLNGAIPHWNDPTHVMPIHQMKHQQSAQSLAALTLSDDGNLGSVHSEGKTSGQAGLKRILSKSGSGFRDSILSGSPSFPITAPESHPTELTPPTSTESAAPQLSKSPIGTTSISQHRLASGFEAPRLRHQLSSSSLRSTQSLRIPPHPLNSPTGHRRGMPPNTAPTRSVSAFNSPSKNDRVPSMHNPPIAPPVVYRENITGHGWKPSEGRSYDTGCESNGVKLGLDPSSSSRSLRGKIPEPTVASTSTASSSEITPQILRRQTASEVASVMSKLPSTNDVALYHQARGSYRSMAETAHLISRFLPEKKTRRPAWERSSRSGDEDDSTVGLTNGTHREAHESLIRMMKETSLGSVHRRSASKSHAYQGLLGSSSVPSVASSQGGIGMVNGRNGPLIISRGGWRGRTPFELSVERCLTQRPKRPMSGMQ